MGDASLFLAQSQLEAVLQEAFEFLLDLLCQRSRPTYTNQPVVGISQVFDPYEVWVVDLDCWHAPHLLHQFAIGFGVSPSFLVKSSFALYQVMIEQILPFLFSSF